MAKRVEIDDRLKEQIAAKCGSDVDITQFVAYQARLVSTEPLSQNSIFDKAVLSPETLLDMEKIANDPLENVTMQVMHDSSVLPVGRLIVTRAVDEFETAARALYGTFIVSTTHPDLISKLDSGIIDEVSVAIKGKKMICSACEKDFYEADEEKQFIGSYFGTCPHCEAKLGKEAHLKIEGVDRFSEVSLVNRGAAHHPKILDKSKQLSLAASSKQIKASLSEMKEQVLNLTLNGKLTDEEDNNMENLSEVLAKLTEVAENLQQLKESVDARFEELAKKNDEAEVAPAAEEAAEEAPAEEAPAEEAPATEEAPAAPVAEETPAEEEPQVNAEAEEVKAELAEMKSFVLDEVNKVLVASGNAKLSEEAGLEDMKNALLSSKLILAASIPTGGVAPAADSNAEDGVKACGYTARQLEALRLKN